MQLMAIKNIFKIKIKFINCLKKINFNQNHFIEFKINVSYIFLSINWKLRSILFKLKLI